MTEITNKKELYVDIFSEVLLDEDTRVNVAINGKIIIKAGYEKALKIIAKLSEHIDYSKCQNDIAKIRTQTVDKLVFVDVDKDTKAIVKEIIKKAVETFGAIYMMKGDIDYSFVLKEKLAEYEYSEEDVSEISKDYDGNGFILMSTAFTMAADKGTNLELNRSGRWGIETHYITGNGILRVSKDFEYNLN